MCFRSATSLHLHKCVALFAVTAEVLVLPVSARHVVVLHLLTETKAYYRQSFFEPHHCIALDYITIFFKGGLSNNFKDHVISAQSLDISWTKKDKDKETCWLEWSSFHTHYTTYVVMTIKLYIIIRVAHSTFHLLTNHHHHHHHHNFSRGLNNVSYCKVNG